MEARASFPAELASAAAARRYAEGVLVDWELDGLRETVRLLVSELVINAVLHAGSGAELCLALTDGSLRVEVLDASTIPPVKRSYSASAPTGRGLLILDDLADRWGYDVGAGGKTVWFELAAPAGAGGRRPGDASAESAT